MAGTKLTQLKEEIEHYIGLPYWRNKLKDGKVIKEGVLGGKGSAKEIALKTIEIANKNNIKLLSLPPKEIYNFQKKNLIGIDCSGLACQLLNFYFKTDLNPRRTSAKMLTSEPLSTEIKNIKDIKTGDMLRFDKGNHVIFVIEKNDDIIFCVQSSKKTKFHGVQYTQIKIPNFSTAYPGNFEGIFRLKRLS